MPEDETSAARPSQGASWFPLGGSAAAELVNEAARVGALCRASR